MQSFPLFFCTLFLLVSLVNPAPPIAASDELRPIITTSEMVVGQNRFGFGLLSGNKFVNRAAVTLRIYSIEASPAQLKSEVDASFIRIRTREAEGTVHRHEDGTSHVHSATDAISGMYVAQVNFAHPGTWGMEMLVKQPDRTPTVVRFSVEVPEASALPAVGSPAPRSRNLIATDVSQLREIDTSPEPDKRLHQIRIADAIVQQKPQLIVFATPQFCTSRMCGPVVEIVRSLLPSFGKRVAFTHQEIWQDFAEKKVFATVAEWRLKSEPWIFVVNGRGTITAKFEGLVTDSELRKALETVLQ